ncbi:LysR family transcriptional regulator [Pararhodobacter sp. CCB-MM2]|uniref:LysR family transcriptional regulator n=1 Tax=Pararhodobacter sp. CCB-MM2 TaxID=1786003 RepID=UPI0008335FF1|nr:LysR family transcriptional regulator [Pararhodobacter sp. CCB-MM2]
MDIIQLRAFLAVADTLHFGQAAQSLDMLPASLGRHIRLLEEQLDRRLFDRTTRQVALTEAGGEILEEARALVGHFDAFEARLQGLRRAESQVLRIGAIDSAATGLIPQLLPLLRAEAPDYEIELIENKTNILLPKLLSGGLDLAFCRPPEVRDPKLYFRTLFYETMVVALPVTHPLAGRARLELGDLRDQPMILPDRRSRRYSHDLTIKLFADAGMQPKIMQYAAEKHTIVGLVSTGTGLAILPRWTERMAAPGVIFLPLDPAKSAEWPQSVITAVWPRGTRDPRRDTVMAVLDRHLDAIAATA